MNDIFTGIILVGIIYAIYAYRKDKEDKEKMKVPAMIIIAGFVGFGLTMEDDENKPEIEEVTEAEQIEESETKEQEESDSQDDNESITREDEIIQIITERAENNVNYNGFEIDDIRVNENMGDQESETLIVLVDFIWTTRNSEETSNERIQRVSQDVAANLHNKGAEDVYEIAIFTEDEYNSKQHKYSYEWHEQGYSLTDNVIY